MKEVYSLIALVSDAVFIALARDAVFIALVSDAVLIALGVLLRLLR